MAVVPVCTKQFVTLEHCYDRWLSNNARFKCEPKAAFSEFFLIEHVFGQLGLLKTGLSKPVLGPFPIQFDTFAGSPVFARNAWFKDCDVNLQQDQAVSLAFLPAWRHSPSLVPAAAQPLSRRKPWEGACRFSAALKCLQSELAQYLHRTAWISQPPRRAQGRFPGRGLTLSPSSFFMILRGVWK